ncbi:PREDICTED: DNA cross-link repair 1A protein [Thamnophis sirtalis]|uniref:DNA cross-link repair 1A protein n=1 Tax=Thamnophis sirtalis TaxID=35019 RepID=A0A6I9XW87_9SAUR|nr:PREDICTED: DNA cross-link repair 1A protein [Thamnophis sirtalis]XP_013918026.1 PREDICTED: DNA cross-link repair 1A protein [Thamnophis sirtalis]
MSEDGLLEEDIWEYKSIRKQKPTSQHSEVIVTEVQKVKFENGKSQRNDNRNCGKAPKRKGVPKKTKQRPKQRDSQTPLKPGVSSNDQSSQESLSTTPAKEKNICKKQNAAKPRPVFEGYCPSCQMPFSLLLIQTPQWHVTECLDVSGTAEKECPDGILCSSAIPSHYKRYSHFQLAASRAQDSFFAPSLSSAENYFIRPDAAEYNKFNCRVLQDIEVPQSTEKSKQSLLLPQLRSMTMDSINITNIMASSLGNIKEAENTIQHIDETKQSHCLNPFYEEELNSQLCSFQQNTSLSDADLNDSEISYSPLYTDENAVELDEADKELQKKVEITCKKNLFDTRNLESGIVGSLSNRSQQIQFQQKSVKMMQDRTTINESSNILPASVSGTSKPLPQKSMHNSIGDSRSFLDQMRCLTGDFNSKKTKDKFDWLKVNSSNFNADHYGQGNSNDSYWFSTDSAVKDLMLSSKSEKEPLQSFQLGQTEVVEKFSNLDVKVKTIVNSCGNRALQNNLCSKKEKEKGSCKNIAMPVLSSTISKTQPVPATNSKVPITPPKHLKQMDIGVFFWGLQPKVKSETTPKKSLSEERVIVNPSAANEKKHISRKRKAEASVGDSDTVTKSSNIKYDTRSDGISGDQRRQKKRYRESYPGEGGIKKQCPFYKKIPGTSFVVDAFQYGEIEGCSAYFLTHFHSDHYGGLTKKFTFPIYCNKITGNLVKNKLRVQEQYVHILPMDKECIIDGIKVVLVDANHCPGAAMIIFYLPNGTVILHTGDFRADPSMERCPFLNGWKVHTVYLDTTYCSPEYTFPSQQEVIQFAVNTAFERVTLNPRTLVVCGTYSVGKEKVFLAIAEVLGSKVSMSQEKFKTLQCLESATINSLISLNWDNTCIHLLPMMQINFKNLQNHLNKFSEKFDHILAFKPTGWTYSDRCCSLNDIKSQTRGNITIYGIPYSEHSSFLEMKQFIQWLKPQKIIPTVNVGNWKVRHEMERYFRDWKMEVAEWN